MKAIANGVSLLFPEGVAKAFTLSYDDGTSTDIRLAETMKRNGVKGTFNLNAGLVSADDAVHPADTVYRLSAAEIRTVFDDPCFEIATHGFSHPYLHKLPCTECVSEVLRDRELLEEWCEDLVIGHAYPYGALNDDVIRVLDMVGIRYARTVEAHHSFRLPDDFMRWGTTCHHKDEQLFELADTFVNDSPNSLNPWLFYVWGHSAEFQRDNNWERMEKLLEAVSGRDDIWYATNGEIYEYITAWHLLRYSADCRAIHNPTALDLWVGIFENREAITRVMVPAGSTVRL